MSRYLMLLRAPVALVTAFSLVVTIATSVEAQRQQRPGQPIGAPDPRTANTQKPPIHARHWLAITGKPLSATAGAMMYQKGGNAVDAAAAMLAAGCTMWDTLGCGGETQALIYNPHTKKVIGINALGVAPTGATAEFYKSKGGMPDEGALSVSVPGAVGAVELAAKTYGTKPLSEIFAPAAWR